MARRSLYAVLTFCITALSSSVSAQDNSDTQMVISIKVCEKAVDGSKRKILAEPTITAVPGRAFAFESGGGVKTDTSNEDFDIGTRVNGKFELTGTGTVQLALKLRIDSTVHQEHDPQTELFRTETIEIRTVLRPGETKLLNCSASQWYELTADPVK